MSLLLSYLQALLEMKLLQVQSEKDSWLQKEVCFALDYYLKLREYIVFIFYFYQPACCLTQWLTSFIVRLTGSFGVETPAVTEWERFLASERGVLCALDDYLKLCRFFKASSLFFYQISESSFFKYLYLKWKIRVCFPPKLHKIISAIILSSHSPSPNSK